MVPQERPILFSGEMVKAILEGRKTQTRRVVKPQWGDVEPKEHSQFPGCWIPYSHCGKFDNRQPGSRKNDSCIYSPYGIAGDRLWVRETWRAYLKECKHNRDGFRAFDMNPSQETSIIEYRAGRDTSKDFCPWKPSIFMPRWASRITLEVVSVRVERLQEIKATDAIYEGAPATCGLNPQVWFVNVWDSLNGKKHPWESNPWVWVVDFKKLEVI